MIYAKNVKELNSGTYQSGQSKDRENSPDYFANVEEELSVDGIVAEKCNDAEAE